MATQYIEDPTTKERIPFEWNKSEPPTSADVASLFKSVSAARKPTPIPKLGEYAPTGAEEFAMPPDLTEEERKQAVGFRWPKRPEGDVGTLSVLPPGVGIPSDKIKVPTGVPLIGGAEISPTEMISSAVPGVPQLQGQMDWRSVESGMNIAPWLMPFLIGMTPHAGSFTSRELASGLTAAGERLPSLAARGAGTVNQPIHPDFVTPGPQPKIAPSVTAEDFKLLYSQQPTVGEAVAKGMQKGTRYGFAGKETPAMEKVYLQRAESAVRDIVSNKENLKFTNPVTGEQTTGKVPTTLEEFQQSTGLTKKAIFTEINDRLKTATGTGMTIKPTELVDMLNGIAEEPAMTLEKGTKAYARSQAREIQAQIDKGGYTPIEFNEQLTKLNQKLQGKRPEYHIFSRSQIDAGIAQESRLILDREMSNLPGEFQELKNRYGAIRSIEDEVHKSSMVDARKKPEGFFDVVNPFATYHILRGMLTGDPASIAAGVAARGIVSYQKYMNNPNRFIKQMFQQVERGMATEAKGVGLGGVYGPMPMTGPPRLITGPMTEGSAPNLPVPFVPHGGGLPVPTGEGFGVEAIRKPELEWWRGPGAKEVASMAGPSPMNVLPPGIEPVRVGTPTGPEGKVPYRPGKPTETMAREPRVSPEQLDKHIAWASDAMAKTTGITPMKHTAAMSAIKNEFERLTGINYDVARVQVGTRPKPPPVSETSHGILGESPAERRAGFEKTVGERKFEEGMIKRGTKFGATAETEETLRNIKNKSPFKKATRAKTQKPETKTSSPDITFKLDEEEYVGLRTLGYEDTDINKMGINSAKAAYWNEIKKGE